MRIELEAKYVVAACKMVDKGNSRLSGVHIMPGKRGNAVICASDGRGLLMIESESDSPKFGFTIPISMAKLIKAKRSSKIMLTIEVSEYEGNENGTKDGALIIEYDDMTYHGVSNEAKNGRFPRVADVVESHFNAVQTDEPGQFDPEMIGNFAAVGKILDIPSNLMRIRHNGEDSALVTFVDAAHVFGLLMPLGGGTKQMSAPEFALDYQTEPVDETVNQETRSIA